MTHLNHIEYLLTHLLGEGNSEALQAIAYSADENKWKEKRLIIVPSNFWDKNIYGTYESLPTIPLQTIENTPILFGSNQIIQNENQIIVYADIVASAFFLLSRYEEWIRKNEKQAHDEHGRFRGKESLPFRAGFIFRPIVEEYGNLLRKWCRMANINVENPDTEKSFNLIFTSDIDTPFYCNNIRQFAGEILRFLRIKKGNCNLKKSFCSLFEKKQNDPFFTIPFLHQLTQKYTEKYRYIIFFKSPIRGEKYGILDKPICSLKKQKIYFDYIAQHNDIEIGLHSSYKAGKNFSLLQKECSSLSTTKHRHHYLRSISFEEFETLIKSGYTDDYTMGYADVAGFRLGTCKSIRWINPKTQKVTSLTLHPLMIMDCTLTEKKYMNLPEKEAINISHQIIKNCKQHGGDLCLLWHNQSVEKENLHRHIIKQILT